MGTATYSRADVLHKSSLRAADLSPGSCMGCGRDSHTAFCDLCAPPRHDRRCTGLDRRRNGVLPRSPEDGRYDDPVILSPRDVA